MDNFTFRQYLKESGYDKMSYQEEVYTTCLGLGNYTNIDLYYQDEIDEAYEQNVPVNELAAKLCAQFDVDYGKPKDEEEPEFEDEEYSQETLDAMADYPQDTFDEYDSSNDFNEATETEETFDDWKGYVFKYLDKRVDVNKIKDLGTYIKDFVKQEWDNGEPSWFAAAESIVNYARTNYPDAIKDRSFATTITESLDGPATFTDELVNQFVRYIKKWFTANTSYRIALADKITKDGEHPYTHEKKKTFTLALRNTPVPTTLYVVVYNDYCYIAAEGDRFTTKSYKFTSIQSLDKALNELLDNVQSVYEDNLDEAFLQDDRGNVSVADLADKILEKAGFVVDPDDRATDAAYYISAFYARQSMPINGMVMWGSRDLKSFMQKCNASDERSAISNTRSVMLGKPGRKAEWIEELKKDIIGQRNAAEEKRRQDYLNSEEHKHMQDPGWRGPRGTWSND